MGSESENDVILRKWHDEVVKKIMKKRVQELVSMMSFFELLIYIRIIAFE